MMVSMSPGHTLGYIGATPKIGFSYTSTDFVAELLQVPLFQLIVYVELATGVVVNVADCVELTSFHLQVGLVGLFG